MSPNDGYLIFARMRCGGVKVPRHSVSSSTLGKIHRRSETKMNIREKKMSIREEYSILLASSTILLTRL